MERGLHRLKPEPPENDPNAIDVRSFSEQFTIKKTIRLFQQVLKATRATITQTIQKSMSILKEAINVITTRLNRPKNTNSTVD
jgi:hypothetical protein